MRRNLVFGQWIGLWICLMTVLPSRAWSETLQFCYDPYPPYTLGQEGPAAGGLKVELLDAVMARIEGLSAEVTLLPWKRCQAMVRSGQFDGILPLFRNAERASYMAFSIGTFNETSRFWYRRDSTSEVLVWDGDFANIAHLRLGMLNGGFIDQEMEARFEKNHPILRARDVRGLMQLLLKERVDLIATDDAVGRHTLATNGWSDLIAAVTRPISGQLSVFGLSRASGADVHLEAMNAALQAMHDDGTIAQIFQGLSSSSGQ